MGNLDRRLLMKATAGETQAVEPLGVRGGLESLFAEWGNWRVSKVRVTFADGDVYEYERGID